MDVNDMLVCRAEQTHRSNCGHRTLRARRVLLLLSLTLLSCVSNKQSLEETPGYAARRHYIEAAQRYNQAVRGQFMQTRKDLAANGPGLIQQHLRDAEAERAVGRHVRSADHYRAAQS